MNKIFHCTLAALAACLMLTACSAQPQPWASISGRTIETDSAGEDFFFQIVVGESMLDVNAPVNLYTSGVVRSGELKIELRDPQGNAIWNPAFSSEFRADARYILDKAGTYSLGAAWDGPLSATFDLSWNSIALTAWIIVPGLGMLLVAVAFLIYGLRRGAGWKMLALGALAWVLTVAVKFLIAIPLNPGVAALLYQPGSLWNPRSILFYLYIGLLTGLTEVLLTWLVLRYTRLGQADWRHALAFSLGFGVFEAALLGLASFSASLTALLSPASAASSIGNIALANHVLYGLAPVAERIAVILVHLVCNLWLFYGARTRQWRWFWYAFALKSLMDAVAGFAQAWGVQTIAKIWAVEGVLLVFGLLAWYWAGRLRMRYPAVPAEAEAVA